MSVLVQKSVKRTLFNMAVPMLAGTFAMNAYTLTDTWFIAQLGTLPLAAMGFTFPVVMLLTFIAGGLSTGVTTLMSHAVGRHNHAEAARLVTHGIALTMAVTVLISVAGYLSIDLVFRSLGADESTLPLVGEYMGVWYLGALFMSLPMLGNGLLISMGDSKEASRFMILGTLINAALNPFLIFGWMGCPAMGIRGSALATVIAQAISTVWLFRLLGWKHRLLVLGGWRFEDFIESTKRILHFGIPAVLSMALMPISSAVITWIISGFGHEAVAACGAAGRVEMFAFVIPMALGMSMTPFVSQNHGAGRLDRIREAMTLSTRFAIAYGGAVAVLFFACAPWMASMISSDPKVAAVIVDYIRIISFGYGMMEVHRYCGFILTGLHRPKSSTLLNAIRILALLIPLSFLGAKLFGIRGVFIGRLVTDITVGCVGIFWVSRVCASRLADTGAADEGEPVQEGMDILIKEDGG